MQIRLYCTKQLETTFYSFCEKPLHITFKPCIASTVPSKAG